MGSRWESNSSLSTSTLDGESLAAKNNAGESDPLISDSRQQYNSISKNKYTKINRKSTIKEKLKNILVLSSLSSYYVKKFNFFFNLHSTLFMIVYSY